LLENSPANQPDNLLNQTQISPGNQTKSNSFNPRHLVQIGLVGGTTTLLAIQARKQYQEKTREKAATKIQSLVRMHQAQKLAEQERVRQTQEEAKRLETERQEQARQAQNQRQIPIFQGGGYQSQSNGSFFIQPSPATSTNPILTEQNQKNTPNSETPSQTISNSPISTPGGNYSGTTSIITGEFSPSPDQLVQEILHQSQKAIQSQQIPLLETAENKITSLFAEPNPAKKQVYYQYQPQLEDKLQKVLQTKTIQEIKINHLDIAQQIQPTIEPQKISQKD
jgi:IQ calmodulin-binding motif